MLNFGSQQMDWPLVCMNIYFFSRFNHTILFPSSINFFMLSLALANLSSPSLLTLVIYIIFCRPLLILNSIKFPLSTLLVHLVDIFANVWCHQFSFIFVALSSLVMSVFRNLAISLNDRSIYYKLWYKQISEFFINLWFDIVLLRHCYYYHDHYHISNTFLGWLPGFWIMSVLSDPLHVLVKVTWRWLSFTNSARKDNLELYHWVCVLCLSRWWPMKIFHHPLKFYNIFSFSCRLEL